MTGLCMLHYAERTQSALLYGEFRGRDGLLVYFHLTVIQSDGTGTDPHPSVFSGSDRNRMSAGVSGYMYIDIH